MWPIHFIFPYRLHRLEYFLRGVVLNAVAAILYVDCGPDRSTGWWAAFAGMELYGVFFIVLPRVRDLTLNGWWTLMIFVPIANVVFGLRLLFGAPVYLRNVATQKAQPKPTHRTA